MSPKKKPLLPRPLDVNEIAFRFVRQVTGDPIQDAPTDHATAAEMGRRGGKKGGKARDKALSKAKKRAIAVAAAKKRWDGRKSPE